MGWERTLGGSWSAAMSAPADEVANLPETPAAASTTEAVAVPARFESRYLRDYFLDHAFDEMFAAQRGSASALPFAA